MQIQKHSHISFTGVIPPSTLKTLKMVNTPTYKQLYFNSLSFNAVYKSAQKIDPRMISRDLLQKYGIKSDFNDNPLVAAFSALTANIFHKLHIAQPSNILLKNLKNTAYNDVYGLCIVHPKDDELYRVFKKDFPLKTIILNSDIDWENIQQAMIRNKLRKHSSTGHFLTVSIHEAMHSAHCDNIMKIHSNSSSVYRKLQKNYTNKNTLSIVRQETSNYAAKSPSETIAEEFTELIVNSLNYQTLLPNEMIYKMNCLKEPIFMFYLCN